MFARDGYTILFASDASEAMELLVRYQVGVILTDRHMLRIGGTELLHKVKDIYPDVVRIMISGRVGTEDLIDAINQGSIYKFFTKPWNDEQLRANIHEAFRYHEFIQQSDRAISTCEASSIGV